MIVDISVDNILISYSGAVSSINFQHIRLHVVYNYMRVAQVLVLCPFAHDKSYLSLVTKTKTKLHGLSLRANYSRFPRQEPLLFFQVAPQLYSRG
jgi:hypothetical protein